MLCRAVLDALLPPGSLWSVEDDSDLDKLLDGMAANSESVRAWLHSLARLRSPMLTDSLVDLEREFGIIPDDLIAELTRRQRLLSVKTAVNSDGSAVFMQNKLQAAGFNVQVHINSPPIDPTILLGVGTVAVCGNDTSQFGREGVVFGGDSQVDMLVNGLVYVDQVPIGYAIPPEEYWSLIFFVGGDAVRNEAGELVSVETVAVDIRRRQELDSLIIRYKPLITWCGPLIDYKVI